MIVNIFFWMLFGTIAGWVWALLHIQEVTEKPAVSPILAAVTGSIFGGLITKPWYANQSVEGISVISIVAAVAFALVAIVTFEFLEKLKTRI